MSRIYRILALSLLATLLAAPSLFAQELATVAGNHPLQAERMTPTGVPNPQMPLKLSVTMALRNQHALDQLIQEQQDPSSFNYHRWLTPAQFAAAFGPTPSDFAAVKDWLVSQGFKITSSSLKRRVINFTGSVNQAEGTFGVTIKTFGHGAYANTQDPAVPVQLRSSIAAIGGLNNMIAVVPTSRSIPADPGDGNSAAQKTSPTGNDSVVQQPGTTKAGDASADGRFKPETYLAGRTVFGPKDFHKFYQEQKLNNLGVDGAVPSDCIGIIGDSDYMSAAVSAFNSKFKLPPSSITQVLADNADPGFNDDELEALLDLEWSHAVAPGAAAKFYVGTAGDITGAISAAVTDANRCGTISISFGFCGEPSTFYTGTLHSMFSQAAAQGQSVFVSAGDWGAAGLAYNPYYGCVLSSTPSVNEMSADPYVTSVGGTSFVPNYVNGVDAGHTKEWTWNDPHNGHRGGGATGGGISAYFAKPSYQTGPGVPPGGNRDVPDVALIASPYYPGVPLAIDLSCFSPFGCLGSGRVAWAIFGGTSLSSPAWAGFSRLLAQIAGNPTLGPMNYPIYSLANAGQKASGFRDITSGNNNYNHVKGYKAGKGYDMVTGWGTVGITKFARAYDATQPGPSTLSVTPTSLTFNKVPVGTRSKGKHVTITNQQTVWATIGDIVGGNGFKANKKCKNMLLGPGQSCRFAVTFRPKKRGAAPTTDLQIEDNASDSPQGVTLNGTGK